MVTEADNFKAFEGVKSQLDHFVKVGFLEPEKARDILTKATASYLSRAMLKAVDRYHREKK